MGNIKTLKPFQKGEDPRRNTKGRPKLEGSFRERLRQKVNETKVLVNGEEMDYDLALILQIMNKARAGDFRSAKFIIEAMHGKPKAMCPGCQARMDREASGPSERDIELEEERRKKAYEFMEKWVNVDKKSKKK